MFLYLSFPSPPPTSFTFFPPIPVLAYLSSSFPLHHIMLVPLSSIFLLLKCYLAFPLSVTQFSFFLFPSHFLPTIMFQSIFPFSLVVSLSLSLSLPLSRTFPPSLHCPSSPSLTVKVGTFSAVEFQCDRSVVFDFKG